MQIEIPHSTVLNSSETLLLCQPKKVYDIYKKIEKLSSVCRKITDCIKKDGKCFNVNNSFEIGSKITFDKNLEIFLGLNPCVESNYIEYAYSIGFWSKTSIYGVLEVQGNKYEPFVSRKRDCGGYWTYYKLDNDLFYADNNQERLKIIVNEFVDKIKKR